METPPNSENVTAQATLLTTGVAAPPAFDFKHLEEWPWWITRFDRYLRVPTPDKEDKGSQVDAFLGEDAEDFLTASALTDAKQRQFEAVSQLFERHFVGKRNAIYERAKFHQKKQELKESIESLVTYCGYGALKEEFVGDRFVVGLQDFSISKKL